MNSSLLKKISSYSAIAGLTLATDNAYSQIVYHDIMPDYTGNEDAIFQIDLNNDGSYDFKLKQESSSSYTYITFTEGVYMHNFQSNQLSGSGINNAKVFCDDSIIVLQSGDTIGPNSPWNGGAFMRFKLHEFTFQSHDSNVEFDSEKTSSLGNWLGVTNKFIGIKVLESGQPHFGWIRLTVNDYNFTVKDYAINELPNTPIQAGEISCENLDLNLSTANGDTISCYGNPFKLFANAPTTLQHTYQWLENGQVIPGADDSIYFALNEGAYSFSVTFNGTCSDSSETLNVAFPPTPSPVISVSNDTLFSNYQNGNQWYFNQFIIPGATDNYYVASQSGTYKLKVDTFNCYGFSSDINFFPTGSESVIDADVSFYADGSKLLIKVNSPNFSVINVMIYNMMGQLLENHTISDPELTIHMDKYPSGNYVAAVNYGRAQSIFKFTIY
jgi:hypothetical protein